jgi:hypothetical protein
MASKALPALLAAALLLGSAPVFAGPADDALFGKSAGDGRVFACFIRHYDKAHLKSHPQQNVTDMLLLVDRAALADEGSDWYALSLGVNFRKVDTQFQVAGGCGAGDGKTLLNCGIDCDGGQIDVRLRDEKSILVDIPYGARTWDPGSDADPPAEAAFGEDDKLFRLDRTELSQCLDLVYDDDVKAQLSASR